MSLRIVPASQPIEIKNIVLTEYSVPGLGKSSLAYTAEAPLMLAFDGGCYRAAVRRGDTVLINAWEDVEGISADDLEPYKTVIIDTGGRAGDLLKASLIKQDPKNSGTYGGLSGKGWGNMASRLNRLVTLIRSEGKDLIIVMHCDEKGDGDDIKERIDAQGAWKNEIYKVSDAMCRIRIRPNGERYLDFDPSESGFGKNPAALPKMTFPHPEKSPEFLAGVIASIKASINKLTAEQAAAVKAAEDERAAMEKLFAEHDTLEKFNSVKPIGPLEMAKLKKGDKSEGWERFGLAVMAEGHKRGWTFDKPTGVFVVPAETAKAGA